MSHAKTADELLIKPAADARPAPPCTRGQFIPKARTKRPVTRRVTHDTATTRLASVPDRHPRRVLPSPERSQTRVTPLAVSTNPWPSFVTTHRTPAERDVHRNGPNVIA